MLDFSLDDIRNAVIGAISGAVTTYIVVKYSELKAFFTQYNKITPFLRTWHSYHWSRVNNEPEFRAATWVFKRDFPGGIRIEITDDKKQVHPYKGKVAFEVGQMVISGESYYPDETWSARLTSPQVVTQKTIMFGIQLVQDFDRKILATMTVCCQDKKSDEEAKLLIGKYTDLVVEESSLRCKQ